MHRTGVRAGPFISSSIIFGVANPTTNGSSGARRAYPHLVFGPEPVSRLSDIC